MKKIAVEEHFFNPESMALMKEWKETHTFPEFMDPEATKAFLPLANKKFPEHRIPQMDQYEIEVQILGTGAPGIQGTEDPGRAVEMARRINDSAAAMMSEFPGRFLGYAALPLQDPEAAVRELEYCVRKLGFRGAMIQGSNQYHYMDAPEYDIVWSGLEELDVPLSLHVFHSDPQNIRRYDGFTELLGPAWDWNAEAAYHTLRMVFGGVFEKHPKAKLILGHLGESIPYILGRIDEGAEQSAAVKYGKITKAPSEYIKDHIYVATSGMYTPATLRCAIDNMGIDKVLFATDYPFFDTQKAVTLVEEAKLSEEERASVFYENARRLFHI